MYPATTPLPLLIELPLQIPFCELETDKAQLEDKLFRWTYFETDQPEKTFKETAIKLFAVSQINTVNKKHRIIIFFFSLLAETTWTIEHLNYWKC